MIVTPSLTIYATSGAIRELPMYVDTVGGGEIQIS